MKVLVDSDVLFALYVASDLHHNEAKKIFERLLNERTEFLITNLVLQEAATVISYRFGQNEAKDFLKRFNRTGIGQIFIGERLTAKAWKTFKEQRKKRTSFVDCANAVTFKELKIDQILSFDRFYQKIGLKIAR